MNTKKDPTSSSRRNQLFREVLFLKGQKYQTLSNSSTSMTFTLLLLTSTLGVQLVLYGIFHLGGVHKLSVTRNLPFLEPSLLYCTSQLQKIEIKGILLLVKLLNIILNLLHYVPFLDHVKSHGF